MNKKKSSSVIQNVEEECKIIKHSRNSAKSPSSTANPGNTSFEKAKLKISERNESYVDNEMLADGKLFRINNWIGSLFIFMFSVCCVYPYLW